MNHFGTPVKLRFPIGTVIYTRILYAFYLQYLFFTWDKNSFIELLLVSDNLTVWRLCYGNIWDAAFQHYLLEEKSWLVHSTSLPINKKSSNEPLQTFSCPFWKKRMRTSTCYRRAFVKQPSWSNFLSIRYWLAIFANRFELSKINKPGTTEVEATCMVQNIHKRSLFGASWSLMIHDCIIELGGGGGGWKT